ncbi:hypothetical protein GCM10011360_06430 [Primorskyibacter flagellatus]|uniref:Sulphur transport domain-containing protein n=2 Tax=Primorskyibacter flagellatus TaxID=1387277 RepID=A0A916ZZP2_9RHOB|nr:hypothetical protein GCM10011360_06430 [Primorskyibacter flagellatus]
MGRDRPEREPNMQIDWIMGLIGGLLIGSAGAVLLLGNGKIMGASGIIGGLVDGSARSEARERLVFLAGVLVMPLLLIPFAGTPDTNATSNLAVLAAAGLLVGTGTRIANGCTSGHGVCGISRLSLRGIVATVFYILAGGLTIVLFRHIFGVI